MKIIHLCNAPLAADHPDHGRVKIHPGRWALNLARAQREHCQIDTTLVVQVPGATQDHQTTLDTVPVYYVAAPTRLRSGTFFIPDVHRLRKRVRLVNPDLVHAHGTEDAYALAAQRSGLPNVITAQGLHFLINRKVRPSLISRERIVQFTEWFALKRACHIIAKSEYVARSLKSEFPHLIIHSIPNTFDERLLNIDEVKRPNSVIFVGTISPWKGLDTLRQALARVAREVPEIRLDIVGDSPNEPLPYEADRKRDLREALGERVTFHGQVEVQVLARLVASSMALVAPSLEDMFGNQVVEAMLVGTYAIVAEGTALAENVQRFGGGTTVPQQDPKALATAILSFLQNPPRQNTNAVRQAILEYMGPKVVAQRHCDLYRQILSQEA